MKKPLPLQRLFCCVLTILTGVIKMVAQPGHVLAPQRSALW